MPQVDKKRESSENIIEDCQTVSQCVLKVVVVGNVEQFNSFAKLNVENLLIMPCSVVQLVLL